MSQIQSVSVPDIGGFKDVEVIEIQVNVGDKIDVEDSLVTLESDKSAMDIPSPISGVVESIDIALGDTLSEGDHLIKVRVADAATLAEVIVPVATESSTTSPTLEAVIMPDLGGFNDVEIIEMQVAVGDVVAAEDTLITLESDKSAMEIPTPIAGVVASINVAIGNKMSAGDLILHLQVNAQAVTTPVVAVEEIKAKAEPIVQPVVEQTPPHSTGKRAHAGPAVRHLARELGVDLTQVSGSGRKGRILPEDVKNHVKVQLQDVAKNTANPANNGGLSLPEIPVIDFAQFGEIEAEKLSRIKKISGVALHRSWLHVPHVTQFDEADITEMEAFRKSLRAESEALGIKTTPLAFIIKACIAALKRFPHFNASLNPAQDGLIVKKYYHIGFAAETPQGLLVPVIRHADQLGIFELAAKLGELSQKAREGKLNADEMQGGSFTLSSLGGIGGTAFTPIVNAPEVAILGVSKAKMQPVYQGEQFVPRLMLPLSLSYDHRVIDGAAAARFITYLSAVLADMRRLLL